MDLMPGRVGKVCSSCDFYSMFCSIVGWCYKLNHVWMKIWGPCQAPDSVKMQIYDTVIETLLWSTTYHITCHKMFITTLIVLLLRKAINYFLEYSDQGTKDISADIDNDSFGAELHDSVSGASRLAGHHSPQARQLRERQRRSSTPPHRHRRYSRMRQWFSCDLTLNDKVKRLRRLVTIRTLNTIWARLGHLMQSNPEFISNTSFATELFS